MNNINLEQVSKFSQAFLNNSNGERPLSISEVFKTLSGASSADSLKRRISDPIDPIKRVKITTKVYQKHLTKYTIKKREFEKNLEKLNLLKEKIGPFVNANNSHQKNNKKCNFNFKEKEDVIKLVGELPDIYASEFLKMHTLGKYQVKSVEFKNLLTSSKPLNSLVDSANNKLDIAINIFTNELIVLNETYKSKGLDIEVQPPALKYSSDQGIFKGQETYLNEINKLLLNKESTIKNDHNIQNQFPEIDLQGVEEEHLQQLLNSMTDIEEQEFAENTHPSEIQISLD